MDQTRGVPDVSSPVVLLPNTARFRYPVAGPDVAASDAATASARYGGNTNPSFPRNVTTSPVSTDVVLTAAAARLPSLDIIAAYSAQPPDVRTLNPLVGGTRAHDEEAGSAGPTTRSRKRAHNSSIPVPTEVTAAAMPAAAPSRKRKSPSSPSAPKMKACNRKKPPPGAELKEPPPGSKNDDASDKKKPTPVETCCICMCEVEPSELAIINSCEHKFCFDCIDQWSQRENKCPLCKSRFNKIERVHKRRKKGTKNSKRVKQRDQRQEIPHAVALEGLIANLNRSSGSLARIIFGGFEFGQLQAGHRMTTRHTPGGALAEFVDEDSEDDDSPMAAFMRALHGAPAASGVRMSTTVVQPMTVSFTTHTRSYAINNHDSTAGSGVENPLEIDDDSVDEVIEIE